jgi:acyl carrier protein
MPPSDHATKAVWETLWQSLDGARYDIDSLRAKARDDSHLIEEVGMDSLDLLEFYLRLGEKFNVDVTEEDYPQLVSVSAVARYLKDKATKL